MIAPKFQAMSEKYKNVIFVKVDVDVSIIHKVEALA